MSWDDDEATKYWNQTRHDTNEYNKRTTNIEEQGILCKLQFQQDTTHSSVTDPFYYLRVTFPPNFKHLIKPEAVKQKEETPTGFHISLGNKTNFDDNYYLQNELKHIQQKYHQPQTILIKHMYVARSSVINIIPPDPLYYELKNLVYQGTWKNDVHISLD